MGKHDAIHWDDALQRAVLDSIESGLSLRKAAEEHNISVPSMLRRCRESSAFAEQYARALELRCDLEFEQLIDDLDQPPERTKFGIDPAWVQWKRLKVDTLKWALSKRVPKKYGDRVDHNVDGQIAVTFSAKSILDAVPEPKQLDAGPKQIEGEIG